MLFVMYMCPRVCAVLECFAEVPDRSALDAGTHWPAPRSPLRRVHRRCVVSTPSTSVMAESKSKGGQPVRLYVKGALVGYKGSKVNQYHHTSLIKVQNLSDAKDAGFYLGKRVAYIYKVSSL